MITIDGLWKAKEEISFLIGRKLTKEETHKIDCLGEDKEMKIDNINIKRQLQTLSTFLIGEKENVESDS